MKKLMSVIFMFAILVNAVSVSQLAVNAKTSGDFYYNVLDDGTACIVAYLGNAKDVTIPSEIDNHIVTSIYGLPKDMFGDLDDSNFLGIESITLPDTLETIGQYAFYNCGLKSVRFGKGLKAIEDCAFYGCSNLTEISLPIGLNSIGYSCFDNCTNLAEITLPNTLNKVGGRAFYRTKWYKNQKNGLVYYDNYLLAYKGAMPVNSTVNVKEGTTLVADNLFKDKSNLCGITLPEGLKYIGQYAFSRCKNLKEVAVPESVTSFGTGVFEKSKSLEKVNIPEKMTVIADRLLTDCNSIKNIKIPNKVVKIGEWAFSGCSLKSVRLPASLKIIAKGALSENLFTTIKIPETVTYIGDCAFEKCVNLKYVKLPKGITAIREFCFYNCTSLAYVGYYNTIKYIGNNAFENCTALTAFTIKTSVIKIEDKAFYNCKNLKTIINRGKLNIVGSNVFEKTQWYKDKKNGLVYSGVNLYKYKGTMPKKYTAKLAKSTYCIGSCAFLYQKNLVKVVLPKGIKGIGDNAFNGCENLKSINIPNSVKYVGEYAFDDTKWYNTQKDGVVYGGKVALGYKGNLPKNKKITIKDGTKSIADDGFITGDHLEKYTFTVPTSVTYIGEDAFIFYCGDPDCDEDYYNTYKNTILCEKGSYAEKYALKYGYKIKYR